MRSGIDGPGWAPREESQQSSPPSRPDPAKEGIMESMSELQIFGVHEDKTVAQLKDVAARADGHVGYVMPIGGVAAYRDKVSVVGVGFDIACGNAAIRTDLALRDVNGRLPQIADEISEVISFGMGRKNRADDAPTAHALFED